MDGRHIGWGGSAGPEIKSDKQPARWKHRRRSGLAAARSAAPRVSNIQLPSSSSTVVVISVGTALAAGPCAVWVPCEVPALPGPALAPLLPEHRTSPHPPPNLVGANKKIRAVSNGLVQATFDRGGANPVARTTPEHSRLPRPNAPE